MIDFFREEVDMAIQIQKHTCSLAEILDRQKTSWMCYISPGKSIEVHTANGAGEIFDVQLFRKGDIVQASGLLGDFRPIKSIGVKIIGLGSSSLYPSIFTEDFHKNISIKSFCRFNRPVIP